MGTEAQLDIMLQRESLNGRSLSNPFPENSGNPSKNEAERLQEPDRKEGTRIASLSKPTMLGASELIETGAVSTGTT